MKFEILGGAVCSLALACSSVAQNPDRSSLAPASNAASASAEPKSVNSNASNAATPPTPSAPTAPQSKPDPAGAKPTPAKDAKDANDGGQVSAPTPKALKGPNSSTTAGIKLPVAFIDHQPIDVRSFLTRMWLRDSSFSREILDQLVVSELALREAERMGIKVDEKKVDEATQHALDVLAQRLKDKGSSLSVEQHVRQNLGVNFDNYKRELRSDAVIQMLAERAVRAYALASERVVVRLLEVDGREKLDQARAELDQGADIGELAKKYGTDEIKKAGAARMTILNSENSKLSRLAFATPVGKVGGPLEEGGRYLLLKVEQKLEPKSGSWKEVGPFVEASLAEQTVDDLEYAQWKTAVGRVYDVDLAPFLELIDQRSN